MTADFMTSLAGIVAATRSSRDPWWLIGSAAMALHGLRDLHVWDVDVMMSANDALRILQEQGIAGQRDGGTARFRSDVFGRLPGFPLSIEVLGGFHVREGSHWRELVPKTRIALTIPAGLVFVPTRRELIDITRRLGRGKDFARAEMLEALR